MDLLFIDAAGVRALVAVNNALRRQQRRLVLINASGLPARVLNICRMTYLFTPLGEIARARRSDLNGDAIVALAHPAVFRRARSEATGDDRHR